jgi:hypothetical protein
MIKRTGRTSGFFALDALAGIFLLLALTMVLAVSASLRQRNTQRFAEQRQALAMAQEVLANLRSGGQPVPTDATARVSVERSGRRLADLEWVQVTVVRAGRRASLVGLARGPATRPAGGTP